ncbi:neuritin 1b [Pimephales promelas]|uniref:neuritin 1b n=1 Tax=Pimephales promelas TaxID=90988 RepID=UPI001955A1DE|nr:neuritin 1b [Pimephales promelas]KAG1969504.1 neuritin [Pimephales promelas]
MGVTSTDKYNLVLFTLELVSLVQGTCATCENIFKGFSDCLLSLGENMVNYPQELDDSENLQTICSYWNDFHSCASTAIADCQEGAGLWEKLKLQSRSLNYQGSLFELCSRDNGVSRVLLPMELKILLMCFTTLVAWLVFELET